MELDKIQKIKILSNGLYCDGMSFTRGREIGPDHSHFEKVIKHVKDESITFTENDEDAHILVLEYDDQEDVTKKSREDILPDHILVRVNEIEEALKHGGMEGEKWQRIEDAHDEYFDGKTAGKEKQAVVDELKELRKKMLERFDLES